MVQHPDGLKQEDYIYDLEWDANVVGLFTDVLADQARMGNFHPNRNNRHAIQTAQYMLKKFFNKDFSLKECVGQLHLLRKRHLTFSNIITRDDVAWANENNEMAFTEESWADIVSHDEFAWAYAQYGDPNWDDLQAIFGPPTEVLTKNHPIYKDRNVTLKDAQLPQGHVPKRMPMNEVINISSDKSESLSASFWNSLGVLLEGSDEATSTRNGSSLKTEMSSTNPSVYGDTMGKFIGDHSSPGMYGPSYVSSSSHASPNEKK